MSRTFLQGIKTEKETSVEGTSILAWLFLEKT